MAAARTVDLVVPGLLAALIGYFLLQNRQYILADLVDGLLNLVKSGIVVGQLLFKQFAKASYCLVDKGLSIWIWFQGKPPGVK